LVLRWQDEELGIWEQEGKDSWKEKNDGTTMRII
jgi:hypothetical protein